MLFYRKLHTMVKNPLLFIPSAFHRSWCFQKVIPYLEAEGHTVFTPDVPSACIEPYATLTLKTYVASIEMLIQRLPKPVVLVAHAMGAPVAFQVAENRPDCIGAIICFSGVIPDNGTSIKQEKENMMRPGIGSEIFVDEAKSEIFLKLSPRIPDLFYNDCSIKDRAFALSRLQPHPLHLFTDPVFLSHDRFGSIPNFYIQCLKNKAISPEDQARMSNKIDCVLAHLDTGHVPFLSDPAASARLILQYCRNNLEKRLTISSVCSPLKAAMRM